MVKTERPYLLPFQKLFSPGLDLNGLIKISLGLTSKNLNIMKANAVKKIEVISGHFYRLGNNSLTGLVQLQIWNLLFQFNFERCFRLTIIYFCTSIVKNAKRAK